MTPVEFILGEEPLPLSGQDTHSNDEYRPLFDNLPEAAWVYDVETLRILEVNQAAILKYGYSRQEFLSMTIEELRLREDISRLREDISCLRESLPGRRDQQSAASPNVWRHRSKGGRILEVEVAGNPIVFAGREAQLVVARDMVVRRQAENCLSLRYALTRLLSEGSGDVLKKALRCLCEGLEFDAAELWDRGRDGNLFCRSVRWHGTAAEAPDLDREGAADTLEARNRVLAHVWASGAARWISEPADLAYWDRAGAGHDPGVSSALAFAVRSHVEVNGIVVLLNRKPRQPDPLVVGLLADIAAQLGQHIARCAAEEELRQAEEDFRTLYSEAPVAYHEIDRSGRVVRVNRAECEMLGMQEADMVGRPVWEFVSPEQWETSRAAVERKLHDGKLAASFERTYQGRDGVEHVCEVSERLIVNGAGEITGIRTAMLDLTHSKRAQQKIAFQAALLCHANDATVALDTDFKITYWNSAAERLFERPAEEALGKRYSEVVQSAISEPERQGMHGEIFQRGQWRGELVCHKRSGDQIILELSASLFPDEKGNAAGIVCIHHDVTSRRRTEAALQASENRFKLAQSVLAIGTWELDLESGRAACSDQMLHLFGIQEHREGFTKEEWIQFVHPDDRERILAEFQASLQSGVAVDRHYRTVWQDGSVRWLFTRSHVMLDANGRPGRVVGMSFDETEQVRDKERLRFLSNAVEQSPVSIVITDLDGNIEYANPKTTEVTGYAWEELKGKNPRILKSGQTSEEEYRELWKTIRTGEWRGTFLNKKKNGDLFWEEATIRPIRGSSGAPTHYLALKEDVTARKLAENALRRSETKFRTLYNSTSDAVMLLDHRGFFDCNKAALTMFGCASREEFSLRHPGNMSPSAQPCGTDSLTLANQHIAMAIETGTNQFEWVHKRLDTGETFPAEVLLNAMELDGKRVLQAVVRDITRRKRAENALRESELKYRTLVRHIPQRIIYKDRESVYVSCNDLFAQDLGVPAADIAGRSDFDFYPPELAEKYRADDRRIMELGRAVELEEDYIANGKPCTVFTLKTPVISEQGKVIGVFGVFTDITDRKRAEAALRQSERQLVQAQKLESIGLLAAGIAHEINTPIQYVGDNAKFLEEAFRDLTRFVGPQREIAEALRRSQEPGLAAALDQIFQEVDVDYLREEVPKAIGQLSEGVEQVARIVRAMKEFSHPGPVERVPLDINRAIESTILVSKNEWKYVAELTTNFDPALPLVPCVAGEFNQVVLNLIVNAAHAIADVMKTTRAKGVIKISTRRRGEWAEVRVTDTGTGIPEAIQAKVFDPFFTTKEVGKGTGQGLSIAHAVIVQKHRGTLRFETELAVGTTFIIQIPLEGNIAGETNSICG